MRIRTRSGKYPWSCSYFRTFAQNLGRIFVQFTNCVLEHKTQKTNQKRIRKGETIMVNVGIIGAGRIGQVHMNSILTRVPNAKIKAVADPFLSEEADKKAKAAGAEYTTKDYKDILADKDIDAVIICSSTDTHSPISIEAIKAGKHVFCEKPIDHDAVSYTHLTLPTT